MSISFFVAKEKLSDAHHPVKANNGDTVYIRAVTPGGDENRAEHPGHAAARHRDRMMDGEIFLNAVPDKLDTKNHRAAFNWKKGSAGAEKLEIPNGE